MPDPRWQRYARGCYHLPGDGFCAIAWQADGKLARAMVNQGTTYRSGPETIARFAAPTLEEVKDLAERAVQDAERTPVAALPTRMYLDPRSGAVYLDRGQQTLPEVETT